MLTYITNKINTQTEVQTKTLGLVERYAIEYRQNLCLKKIERKYIDNVNPRCCKKLEDVPQEYGCERPYRKHRKRKHRFHRKYRKYRTQGKPWKKIYSKRFRRPTKHTNKKYSPKGKKNFRCWKCQEIGHYANECPKENRKAESRLHMVNALGFEPIEDIYSDNETIDFDTYGLVDSSDSESYTESETEDEQEQQFY